MYRWTKAECTDGQKRDVQMDKSGKCRWTEEEFTREKDEKCKHRKSLAEIIAL